MTEGAKRGNAGVASPCTRWEKCRSLRRHLGGRGEVETRWRVTGRTWPERDGAAEPSGAMCDVSRDGGLRRDSS